MENVRRFRSPRGSAARGFWALVAVACIAGLIWSAIAGRRAADGDRATHATGRAPGRGLGSSHRSDTIARELRVLESGDLPDARSRGMEARARTEEYEATLDEHEARTASFAFTSQVTNLLASARARVGHAPSIGDRLLPPSSATADDRAAFAAAADEVEEIHQLLEAAADQARRRLTAYAERYSASPHGAVIRGRIQQRRGELDDRAADAEEVLTRTRERLREHAERGGGRALAYWRALTGGDPATELEQVEALLGSWGATGEQPILGAELTYVQGGIGNGTLPTTSVIPAYAETQVVLPALEDVTLGREVELSMEVKAKAESLGTAKAAYDYVKNELRLEWYAGCLKGSTETLRQGRGNDSDAASLLIALLRAQGTPARYVQGVIELPVGRLAELLGLLESAQVDALLVSGDAPLPSSLRTQALTALTAAGIPFELVTAGGQVSAVRLTHVWVEGYLPYADYRGTGEGVEGKQWVPMDPAIPGAAKYAAVPPVVDALSAMGTSAAALTDEYLEAGAGRSPVEFYRSKIEAFLSSNRPGLTYEKVLRTIESRVEETLFIPGSLPYRVISVTGEYAFLPESSKHRVRVLAEDAGGAMLDVTLPAHQLLGHRSVFAYKPATDADVELVADAGGYFEAPASLVEVLPVVRVDGVERVVASRSVGLGATHAITLELLLPDGSARRIENRVIAGNVVALGIGGPKNAHLEPAAEEADDSEGLAARFLYGRAAAYANAWTEAEEELARLTQVVPVRPTASVVLVQYQLELEEALGQPQRLGWRGLQVDADLRTMTPLELVTGRGKELQRLSGYEGSYLEAKILSDGTGEESVSSVSVIQAAHAQGGPVLRIGPENAAVELPKLVSTPEVMRDVSDQLARGREVIIPAEPLAIRDWTGTGYIATDRMTQEAGYFLSGKVSGGMTVVSPHWWTDRTLVEYLSAPDAPKATSDVTQVARIVMAADTFGQEAIVGRPLARSLKVFVTTANGTPVKGAPVVFRKMGSAQPTLSGPGVDIDGGRALQTWTNERGVAGTGASPDTNILRSYTYAGGTPSPQVVGVNEVSAETKNGAATVLMASRFLFVGLPDVPARIEKSPRNAEWLPTVRSLVEIPSPTVVTVTDQWGNPLANESVVWTSESTATAQREQPMGGLFAWAGASLRARTSTDCGESITCTQSLATLTDTDGKVRVGFIPNWGIDKQTVRAKSGALAVSWLLEHFPSVSMLRAHTLEDPTFGIVNLSWPAPVVVEMWDSQGKVTGRESRFERVSVSMETLNASGAVLSESTKSPCDPPVLDRTAAFETDDAVVFWPRYALEGGHSVRFSASITYVPGALMNPWDAPPKQFWITAGTPALEVVRFPVGLPASPAVVTDEAVGVRVRNPSSQQILLDAVVFPSSSGQMFVRLPPPSIVARSAADPSLMLVDGPGVVSLGFPITPGSAGGDLSLELFAPDFDDATGMPINVPVASSDVRVVPAVVIKPLADLSKQYSFYAKRSYLDGTTPPPEDVIAVEAEMVPRSAASVISWNVNAAVGGVAREQPPARSGSVFSFVPNPGEHPLYAAANGSRMKSDPLAYVVEATANGYTDAALVVQDEIDTIIQEYWNHGLGDGLVGIPARDEFTVFQADSGRIVGIQPTAYTYQLGDPGGLANAVWDMLDAISSDVAVATDATPGAWKPVVRGPSEVIWPTPATAAAGRGPQIFRSLRPLTPPNNGCVRRPGHGVNDPDPDCDDALSQDGAFIHAGPNGRAETVVVRVSPVTQLAVESGWRNPERNEAVGGKRSSAHQAGSAVDLTYEPTPAGPYGARSHDEIRCLLVTAGYRVVNGCSAEGACVERCHPYPPPNLTKQCRWFVQAERAAADYTPCNSGLFNHVHINR